jgi:hypothetical protein
MLMKSGLKWGGGLIALYLGVYYATGAGKLLDHGSKGAVNVVRAFQGR